jgi:membrane associated rhomboid family serine protease
MNWNQLTYRFKSLSIAEKLMALNGVFFVLPFVLQTIFYLFELPISGLLSWFQLSADAELLLFRPWTLISYSFLHSGFFHLFWNMILLYYTGQLFLNLFPARTFTNVYFMGVVLGGVLFVVSYALFPVFQGMRPYMVGASAGVMATFVFISTYTPNQEVRFFFFNVKLKYLAMAFVFLDVIQIPNGNAGGHLAHLGGAYLGFLYASQLQKGRDIGSSWGAFWERFGKMFQSRPNLKKVYKNPTPKTRKTASVNQQKIDTILDKISTSGYDSLTKEEKDILFRAGKE